MEKEQKAIKPKFSRGNRLTFQSQGFRTGVLMGAVILGEKFGFDNDKKLLFVQGMADFLAYMRQGNDDFEVMSDQLQKMIGIEIQF